MKKLLPELSVFLPCFNEGENLTATAEKTIPILDRVASKWELLIINDGSTDDTGKVAKKLAQKYPNVRIVTHPVNRGYGASFKSGFYNSKFSWRAFIDADGQFDFKDIYAFVEKQKETGADLVIGYYLDRQVPILRIWASKLWELLVFIFFGLKVRDIDCGFKLVNEKVIKTIPKLESERGPFITSEFLVKAKKSGFKIAEVGVHHFSRQAGSATGAQLKVVVSGFKDLLRLWFKMNFPKTEK
ncbi:MAG: glycosyltransferase family 2 protein [Patescibacteria group bacterium]